MILEIIVKYVLRGHFENYLFDYWVELDILIIKGFRTIVLIVIVIFPTFRLMCPPAFFWSFLSNSGVYRELRTTSFILSTCSDTVNHDRVQLLSILVLLLGCIKFISTQDALWIVLRDT